MEEELDLISGSWASFLPLAFNNDAVKARMCVDPQRVSLGHKPRKPTAKRNKLKRRAKKQSAKS